MKVSFWLDWKSRLFLDSIKAIKDSFSSDDLTDGQGMFSSIDFGEDFTFNVQRRGAGNHPFVLKCGDITLMFSNHKVDAQHPNCRLEIGSVSCWVPGAFDLVDRVMHWLVERGASISQQKIMESHLTVDLLHVDFSQTGLFDINRWICRATKSKLCFENFEPNYFSSGKGKVMMRAYDKTGELKPGSSKEIAFQDLWSAHLGGLPPEHVTRIEFQLRRDYFKESNINTVYQLQEDLNAIWEYCTGEWSRFTSRPLEIKDRKNKNHQRFKTAFLWEYIRSVRFNAAPVQKLERGLPVNHVNVDHLVRQASGCILTVCAAVGHSFDDVAEHAVTATQLISKYLYNEHSTNNKEYKRKMKVKRNQAYVCFDSAYEGWSPQSYHERRGSHVTST
ncbi:MAG: hypothetical protein SD837_21915 [Candidatus Electrothrix scaldis]|nr:MAG: hypothetical protein SD837_21915 [Candidatus Electrothrix sp. GW3-3]